MLAKHWRLVSANLWLLQSRKMWWMTFSTGCWRGGTSVKGSPTFKVIQYAQAVCLSFLFYLISSCCGTEVLGYVPTVKKDGKVRAGQEQIGSVTAVVEKMKKRAEMRKKGILRDEARRGQQLEKAWEIEMQAQMRLTDIKVARDGNSHEHLLNETERTLRFGIFMLTLMYFRAMTYVRREQRSWNADDDEIGVKGKGGKAGSQMTAERMRMLDEERKVAARKKKLDNVLAKSYVGEARRLEVR